MKFLAPTAFILFILSFSSAQNTPPFDSLLQVLKADLNELTEEKREGILEELSQRYTRMDSSEAVHFVNKSTTLAKQINYPPLQIIALHSQANRNVKKGDLEHAEQTYKMTLELSKEIGYLRGEADALSGLCEVNRFKSDYKIAISYCQECIKIKLQIGDEMYLANTYSALGQMYNWIGAYQKASELLFKSLEIAEKLGEKSLMMKCYNDFGNLHTHQNDFRVALDYKFKALTLADELNEKEYRPNILATIAWNYSKQGNHEEALKYDKKALQLQRELDHRALLPIMLANLSDSFLTLNYLDSALSYGLEALHLSEELNMKQYQAAAMITIGKIYAKKKEWSTARRYLLSAERLSRETNLKRSIQMSAEELATIEAKLGNYQAAYEKHVLFKQMSDSLINEDNTRAITLLESEYKFKKERDSIELANQQEKIVLGQTIELQRNRKYMALAGLVILLIVIYFLYTFYQSKQKSNKLLQAKNIEIEQKNKELSSLDLAKSRFFANISHELRTPLTLISGPLESLSHRRTYDDGVIQMALRNTEKLKELVNDILDLSKLESSKPELHVEPIQINIFIKRIFSNYESLANELGIRYKLNLSDSLPAWQLIDSARVEKILNNLLFNAIKFTKSEGEITMRVSNENGWLLIYVSDTGQGISEEDLPHIFDWYFQSKQPDAPLQGGTGIGLALARELALLMEGDLTVESKLGQGSTFILTLPLKISDPSDNPLPHEEETLADPEGGELTTVSFSANAKPDGSRHQVLVVEDNLDMQQYIQQLLLASYQVTLAINGKKALVALENENFDLVITDAMMPEMDGFALLAQLKENDSYRHLPVIMLTALSLQENKMQALTIGVDDYLTKPFSPPELMARVGNLIARHETRKIAKQEKVSDHSLSKERSEDQDSKVVYKSDLQWLKNVEAIVSKELVNNDFQITDLADRFHLSKRQFQRKLKLLTGLTYTEYHHELSLQKARELLENGTYGNVTGVGYAVGINNPSRFSEMYYLRFGKKPVDYFREKVKG